MTRREYWELLDTPAYRQLVYERAVVQLHSDGCTLVPDWYILACWDHDIAYRTHADVWGRPLTRAEADQRFRWAIQHESILGRLNPLSWWRWAGVRLFGRRAWKHGVRP